MNCVQNLTNLKKWASMEMDKVSDNIEYWRPVCDGTGQKRHLGLATSYCDVDAGFERIFKTRNKKLTRNHCGLKLWLN
jgi:hypothetical protein